MADLIWGAAGSVFASRSLRRASRSNSRRLQRRLVEREQPGKALADGFHKQAVPLSERGVPRSFDAEIGLVALQQHLVEPVDALRERQPLARLDPQPPLDIGAFPEKLGLDVAVEHQFPDDRRDECLERGIFLRGRASATSFAISTAPGISGAT